MLFLTFLVALFLFCYCHWEKSWDLKAQNTRSAAAACPFAERTEPKPALRVEFSKKLEKFDQKFKNSCNADHNVGRPKTNQFSFVPINKSGKKESDNIYNLFMKEASIFRSPFFCDRLPKAVIIKVHKNLKEQSKVDKKWNWLNNAFLINQRSFACERVIGASKF